MFAPVGSIQTFKLHHSQSMTAVSGRQLKLAVVVKLSPATTLLYAHKLLCTPKPVHPILWWSAKRNSCCKQANFQMGSMKNDLKMKTLLILKYYTFNSIFVWLESGTLCWQRVEERVIFCDKAPKKIPLLLSANFSSYMSAKFFPLCSTLHTASRPLKKDLP